MNVGDLGEVLIIVKADGPSEATIGGHTIVILTEEG